MSESVDYNAMTRAELNTLAAEQGVENPESYATKADLIEALASVEEAPATDTESPPADQATEPPPTEAPPGEGLPAEGAPEGSAEAPPEEEAPTEPPAYEPITAEDDEENPVFVKLPKTDEEVAEEGNALAQAKSIQTGGEVTFAEERPVTGKRIWSLDAPHNTNDRQGGHGFHRPDYVEHGS
jgi:hypothetical protein